MRGFKGRANKVLAAAAGLFAVAVALKYAYPGSWYTSTLLTIAEASLAGGVADWFAVTALFRRPLGFPYHTAIIPKNRKRLIAGLASAVEQEFLSKESIKARLAEANILNKLIDQTDNASVRQFIWQAIDKLIDELVKTINPNVVIKHAERVIKLVLKRQLAAPHVAAAIRWSLAQGKGRDIYVAIIGELARLAREEKTRDTIFLYLEQIKEKRAKKNLLSALVTGFMETIDGINLPDAAEALQQELIKTVDELKDDNHPVWNWFEEQFEIIAVRLETPEWKAAVADWKDGLLSRVTLAEPLAALVQSVLTALDQASPRRQYVVEWLANQAESYWERFKENPDMQGQAERYVKLLINNMIDNEHHFVGKVATSALQKLSDEDLNQFIEEKTGEDLEWIRINGVIVGGVAGLGLAILKTLM
ncbi:MAG: hypothetical protein K0R55_26 [Sporomusa sp.]|nr:hypothetical protein [Sporomusa sp.]